MPEINTRVLILVIIFSVAIIGLIIHLYYKCSLLKRMVQEKHKEFESTLNIMNDLYKAQLNPLLQKQQQTLSQRDQVVRIIKDDQVKYDKGKDDKQKKEDENIKVTTIEDDIKEELDNLD